jgi:hypothetical protein
MANLFIIIFISSRTPTQFKISHANAISKPLQVTDSDVIYKDHRKNSHLQINNDSIENIVQPPINTEIDDFLDNELVINVIEIENQPQLPFIAKQQQKTTRYDYSIFQMKIK